MYDESVFMNLHAKD